MPRFAIGQKVRILDRDMGARHMRTPVYSRNCQGEITAMHGSFPNPEDLAYWRDGLPELPLYQVRIPLQAIWPGRSSQANDAVLIDIYEHWLEPADHGA